MKNTNFLTVIGSTNMDMVVKTDRFPDPGETIIGGDFFMNLGGKGANQAVSAARMGETVVFISKVGKDNFGEQAISAYKKEGIYVNEILIDEGCPTGIAMITVNRKGENSIVVASGANANLTVADIDKISKTITDSKLVLLQLEIPLSTVKYICQLTSENSIKTILNPAPANELPAKILQGLYLITPNETETEILTGIKVKDEKSARLAANKFKEMGVLNVVITMGAKGCFVATTDEEVMISSQKVNAVDTTAAGDVFNGVLAVGLTKGLTIPSAAQLANRAAAISVTRIGAMNSAPYLHELPTS